MELSGRPAVVIGAAFTLMDIGTLKSVWRVRRSAVVISLVASLGVILLGVLQGIVIAVALAILLFFRRNWWPHGEVLGLSDEVEGWHSIRHYPSAHQRDRIVVFRWEAPLFFANANIFRKQIRDLVREREPRFVIVQCEAITDVDMTAAGVLRDLDLELNAAGVNLAFAELRDRLQDLVREYGLLETLDHDHFYPTLDSAVSAVEREIPGSRPPEIG